MNPTLSVVHAQVVASLGNPSALKMLGFCHRKGETNPSDEFRLSPKWRFGRWFPSSNWVICRFQPLILQGVRKIWSNSEKQRYMMRHTPHQGRKLSRLHSDTSAIIAVLYCVLSYCIVYVLLLVVAVVVVVAGLCCWPDVVPFRTPWPTSEDVVCGRF